MDEQQITEEQDYAGGNGGDDNHNQPRVLRAGSGDESKPRVLRGGSGGEERRAANGHAEEAAPREVHAREVHAGRESARTGTEMVLQSGAVLNTVAQQVLTEWIGYSQKSLERNARALGKLMGCRTPKDVMEVQFSLFKANVEDGLRVTGAVFRISAEKAREAADRKRVAASRSAR